MLISKRFISKKCPLFMLNNKRDENIPYLTKTCLNNLPIFAKIPSSQFHTQTGNSSGLMSNSINSSPWKSGFFTSILTSLQVRPITTEAFITDELKKFGICVYFITNDMKNGEEVNKNEAYISRSKSQIEDIFRLYPNSNFLIVQKTYENKSPLEPGHIALISTDKNGKPMFEQYGSFQGGSSLKFSEENPTVIVKAKYPNGKSYTGFPKTPSMTSYDDDMNKLLSKAKEGKKGRGWYLICMPSTLEYTRNLDNFKSHFDSIKNDFLQRYYVLLCCELVKDGVVISNSQKEVDLHIKSEDGLKLIVDSQRVQANNCINLVFKLLNVYVSKADTVLSNTHENPTTQMAAVAILKHIIKERLTVKADGHSRLEEDLHKIIRESKLSDTTEDSSLTLNEIKVSFENLMQVL